ncbi:hypothetical protein AAG906_040389 [Vitis piasezkii]
MEASKLRIQEYNYKNPQENVLFPQEKGQPLPKFGDWDVNDPTSADGFTMIFNKARDEKKTGGKPDSPAKEDSSFKHGADLGKPQSRALNRKHYSGLLLAQHIFQRTGAIVRSCDGSCWNLFGVILNLMTM